MSRTPVRPRASLDWAAAHARLDRAEATLRETLEPSGERARALLEDRARRLARPPASRMIPRALFECLTFARGRERYALETRFVMEVARTGDVAPLPGAPGFTVGVVNHRGAILPLADLRRLLGGGEPRGSEPSHMVVAGKVRPEIGVLADEVQEIVHIGIEELTGQGGDSLVRGVTRDGLVMLDGPRFLGDPRLFPPPPQTRAPEGGAPKEA